MPGSDERAQARRGDGGAGSQLSLPPGFKDPGLTVGTLHRVYVASEHRTDLLRSCDAVNSGDKRCQLRLEPRAPHEKQGIRTQPAPRKLDVLSFQGGDVSREVSPNAEFLPERA